MKLIEIVPKFNLATTSASLKDKRLIRLSEQLIKPDRKQEIFLWEFRDNHTLYIVPLRQSDNCTQICRGILKK